MKIWSLARVEGDNYNYLSHDLDHKESQRQTVWLVGDQSHLDNEEKRVGSYWQLPLKMALHLLCNLFGVFHHHCAYLACQPEDSNKPKPGRGLLESRKLDHHHHNKRIQLLIETHELFGKHTHGWDCCLC
jgi:hypothetical protein